MSTETPTHFLSQTHCTDDTSSPQPSWSVFQLEEDKQICRFLSVTSSVAKWSSHPGPSDLHISPVGHVPTRLRLPLHVIALQSLHLFSSQWASYNAVIHVVLKYNILNTLINGWWLLFLTVPFRFVLILFIIPQVFGNKKTAVFLLSCKGCAHFLKACFRNTINQTHHQLDEILVNVFRLVNGGSFLTMSAQYHLWALTHSLTHRHTNTHSYPECEPGAKSRSTIRPNLPSPHQRADSAKYPHRNKIQISLGEKERETGGRIMFVSVCVCGCVCTLYHCKSKDGCNLNEPVGKISGQRV